VENKKQRKLPGLPFTRSDIELLIEMSDNEGTILDDNESIRIYLSHGYSLRDIKEMSKPVIFEEKEGSYFEDPAIFYTYDYRDIASVLRASKNEELPEFIIEFKKFVMNVPLEKVPLYAKKKRYKNLVKWRMKIGK